MNMPVLFVLKHVKTFKFSYCKIQLPKAQTSEGVTQTPLVPPGGEHWVCPAGECLVLPRVTVVSLPQVFVANPNKTQPILDILLKNQTKLIEFLSKFQNDRTEDEQFNDEKTYLVKQIRDLKRPAQQEA